MDNDEHNAKLTQCNNGGTCGTSAEALSKRRKFVEAFKLTSERLTKRNITTILKAMYTNEDDELINIEERADKLFNELDKCKQGYIATSALIEKLLSTTDASVVDDFSDIYNKINRVLHTKSEDIISKLKTLQQRGWIQCVPEYKESIEFIVKTITEEHLFELDTTEFKQKVGNTSHNGIDYLVKYSQIEDSKRKEADFNILRVKSKVYSNNTNGGSNSVSAKRNGRKRRRRSSDLTTLISPSILAIVSSQIDKVEQCDFDIFVLDELLGKKASVYVANEILSRFDVIDSEYIEKETFKNFINEITEHYDRVNAIYHNDLHAADVMQTCFVVFVQGNVQKVINYTYIYNIYNCYIENETGST